MFTGIISSTGIIESAEQHGDLRLAIRSDFATELSIGESVACNGCCLTVVDKKDGTFSVDLSAETLACTAPRWETGNKINLERALKLGNALDGHMVTGHVDGVAIVKEIVSSGDSHILKLEVSVPLSQFIAEKGSVCLDGVSLTVNKVEAMHFWVNIIPHTWQNSTLGERKSDDTLNLEIDLIARYVERLMNR